MFYKNACYSLLALLCQALVQGYLKHFFGLTKQSIPAATWQGCFASRRIIITSCLLTCVGEEEEVAAVEIKFFLSIRESCIHQQLPKDHDDAGNGAICHLCYHADNNTLDYI
jgi:hypothetical protein